MLEHMAWGFNAPVKNPLERLVLILMGDTALDGGYSRRTPADVARQSECSEAEVLSALEAMAARGLVSYSDAGEYLRQHAGDPAATS